MHRSRTQVKIVQFLAVLVALLVTGLVAVQPAFAQSPTPTRRTFGDVLLQSEFRREKRWLSNQERHFSQTSRIATDTQNYINRQNGLGKDTSSLTTALSTFNTQVAAAQTDHTNASNTISANLGFDSNGNVTSISQANQTVVTTRKDLDSAETTLRKAVVDLLKAIRAYRKANPKS